MPDSNPYGEPLPGGLAPINPWTDKPMGVTDRGVDPRVAVAATLRVVSGWHECDYRLIADEVELMQPNDAECALCGYEDCQSGCPMTRWRGQS